ncbi:MAG: cupin domain-containing protein [Firmicutes bacterium]|nr:cupin domain-containing protein [Bacillota bacterium]
MEIKKLEGIIKMSNDNNEKYQIHMLPKFDFLQSMDVFKMAGEVKEKWFNQTLCKVNNHLVRLGVFNEGEFHWHKHDDTDEFFYVLSGELFIEFEDDKKVVQTICLKQQHGFCVPKGAMHRPYVKVPTTVLMIEGDSVSPTGET